MLRTRRFSSFTELPEVWRQFITEHAPCFDQSIPWFMEFERHLISGGQRLHIVGVADDGDVPVAVLPLRTDRIALAGPLKTIALTALSNYYTALFGPIVADGLDSEVAAALVQAMLATEEPNVIDLNPLSDDMPMNAKIAAEWRRRGYDVERYLRFGNWYLDVAGRSSTEYFKSLPGNVRSTLQRKGKKLRARGDVVIRIVTAPADVTGAMQAYEAVYQRSWKIEEPHKDFIRSIATEFARRDWLRLGLIEVGSRPAAAQIWFVYRGTASIFKLAYDDEFADLSAGSLLTMNLMQHVIDVDSVKVVDYLCGDDSYKRDWMSARRERIGLRAVRRRSAVGAIASAVGAARRLLSRENGRGSAS